MKKVKESIDDIYMHERFIFCLIIASIMFTIAILSGIFFGLVVSANNLEISQNTKDVTVICLEDNARFGKKNYTVTVKNESDGNTEVLPVSEATYVTIEKGCQYKLVEIRQKIKSKTKTDYYFEKISDIKNLN